MLAIFISLSTFLLGESEPDSQLKLKEFQEKNFFVKVISAFNHQYIVFATDENGTNLVIKHNPGCPCKKAIQEEVHKFINEMIKMQKGPKWT